MIETSASLFSDLKQDITHRYVFTQTFCGKTFEAWAELTGAQYGDQVTSGVEDMKVKVARRAVSDAVDDARHFLNHVVQTTVYGRKITLSVSRPELVDDTDGPSLSHVSQRTAVLVGLMTWLIGKGRLKNLRAGVSIDDNLENREILANAGIMVK